MTKVGDACVQGERLVSVGGEPRRERERFEVWVKDSFGGQVVFVGTPKTLIRHLIASACQRNCVPAETTLGKVERTGELLSVLDNRRWDQVLVKGDVVLL